MVKNIWTHSKNIKDGKKLFEHGKKIFELADGLVIKFKKLQNLNNYQNVKYSYQKKGLKSEQWQKCH